MSISLSKFTSGPLRKHTIAAVGSMVLCFLYLSVTNPSDISLVFLLVPFMLMGVFIHEITYLIFVGGLGRTTPVFRRIVPLGASITIVLALLLQSLNQFTFKDGLILAMFLGVFWIYLWRADFLNK